jgi:hypothetical protein
MIPLAVPKTLTTDKPTRHVVPPIYHLEVADRTPFVPKTWRRYAASFVQFGYHHAGDMDQDCDEKGVEVPVVDGQEH